MTIIAAASAVAIVFNWTAFTEFAKQHDGLFKTIGYVIGPAFAVVGFFWGLADKAELKELSQQLGGAQEKAAAAHAQAIEAQGEVQEKIERIKKLEADLETIADAGRLWKLRENAPFPEYRGWKFDPDGAKVVTIGLFKGGVGKTHLAANFAAYVSQTQQKPVLLIDLDYQGSLSTVVLTAADIEPLGSSVDALLEEDADLATLSAKKVHLGGHGPGVALNKQHGLAKAWLVPSDYTLNRIESRLLIERAMHNNAGLDERYRLAHVLLHPSVRREFAMIIIDTPPRMTLGTVNALVASHYYIVPTILDKVSTEAVKPFLTQVAELSKDLELRLDLAGIVGTMTRKLELTDTEERYKSQVNEVAKAIVGNCREPIVAQTIPRKTQITDKDDLGYFLQDDVGTLKERFYDAVFNDLWIRIMTPQNHVT